MVTISYFHVIWILGTTGTSYLNIYYFANLKKHQLQRQDLASHNNFNVNTVTTSIFLINLTIFYEPDFKEFIRNKELNRNIGLSWFRWSIYMFRVEVNNNCFSCVKKKKKKLFLLCKKKNCFSVNLDCLLNLFAEAS